MGLAEMIGKSITKAPAKASDDEGSPEEENDESPGEALLEAITNNDAAAVDAALSDAIRKFK